DDSPRPADSIYRDGNERGLTVCAHASMGDDRCRAHACSHSPRVRTIRPAAQPGRVALERRDDVAADRAIRPGSIYRAEPHSGSEGLTMATGDRHRVRPLPASLLLWPLEPLSFVS